jgi:tripartite tricarboxylate transporter TctB family protein
MAALSLVLVVRGVLVRDAPPDAVASRWRDVGRALACWAALVASVALLKPLGFVASFALLVVFIVTAMFRRPLLHAALLALASALVFHVLFDVALGVSLPRGRWPF